MADKKQQEMQQQIASFLTRKDYYDVLGIQKTATDGDIKKAYRMLALRFHPDKNQVQGAKEVFKKVSHAYSVLIDAEKRDHYDRFGPQEDRPSPRRRQNSQDDYEYNQYDEIFRAFFGGVPMQNMRRGNGNFRTFHYTFGGANQGQAQNQQQQGGLSIINIIILVVLGSMFFGSVFKAGPSFSSLPTSEHKYKQKTPILNVDFYASQQYFQDIKDPRFKKQSEMIIDRQYLMELEKKCEGKKKEKKRLEEFAYRQAPGVRRDNYLSQAKAVDLGVCRRIAELNEHNQDYIRDLTYMRVH